MGNNSDFPPIEGLVDDDLLFMLAKDYFDYGGQLFLQEATNYICNENEKTFEFSLAQDVPGNTLDVLACINDGVFCVKCEMRYDIPEENIEELKLLVNVMNLEYQDFCEIAGVVEDGFAVDTAKRKLSFVKVSPFDGLEVASDFDQEIERTMLVPLLKSDEWESDIGRVVSKGVKTNETKEPQW